MPKVPERSALDFFPEKISLATLRQAAAGCMGCDLYKLGTQTVFGEGKAKSPLMFIGEQPGDVEDRTGHPFVGPAGRVLDQALEEAGIDRDLAYVTNAVKHFKWRARGKRRIHEKPNAVEISACKPWLEGELATIRPKIVVFLGATAAQAMLGRAFRVTQQRGIWLETSIEADVLATVHPSSILRAPPELRDAQYGEFLRDLKVVAGRLNS